MVNPLPVVDFLTTTSVNVQMILEISKIYNAKITRKYPKEVGVENLSEVSALTQLFWPIFRSSRKVETEKI